MSHSLVLQSRSRTQFHDQEKRFAVRYTGIMIINFKSRESFNVTYEKKNFFSQLLTSNTNRYSHMGTNAFVPFLPIIDSLITTTKSLFSIGIAQE